MNGKEIDYSDILSLEQRMLKNGVISVDLARPERFIPPKEEYMKMCLSKSTPEHETFIPFYKPWWITDVPATIKDDKVNIQIKKKKITFNFND